MEIQPAANDEAHPSHLLHVGEVPVAVFSRRRKKGPPVRAAPVKTIAAIANRQVLRLLALPELAWQDRENAQHQTFVSDGVEVVELRPDVEIDAARIQTIRHHP